jgi:hypothetical protein
MFYLTQLWQHFKSFVPESEQNLGEERAEIDRLFQDFT